MLKVKVAVRVKPFDGLQGKSLAVPIKGQYGQYEFDNVIDEVASQEDVYQQVGLQCVNRFLQGSDCMFILYGAYQTGKTHTFEGKQFKEGIIPRAVSDLCKHVNVQQKNCTLYLTYHALSANHDASLVDILAGGTTYTSLKDISAVLALDKFEHKKISDPEEIYEILRQGRAVKAMLQNQIVAFAMPPSGSRSTNSHRNLLSAWHTMLTLHVVMHAGGVVQSRTKLSFVELVAQEPKDALGRPLLPDTPLSRSLGTAYAALTSVLTALKQSAQLMQKAATNAPAMLHVPWRNSPLTRWLKPALSGCTLLQVIATVSPSPEAASDTLSTLNYVSRFRSSNRGSGVLVSATWESQNQPNSVQSADQAAINTRIAVTAHDKDDEPLANRSSPPRSTQSPIRSPRQTNTKSIELNARPVIPTFQTGGRLVPEKSYATIRRGSTPTKAAKFSDDEVAAPVVWQVLNEPGASDYSELTGLLRKVGGIQGAQAKTLLDHLISELEVAKTGEEAARREAWGMRAQLVESKAVLAALEGASNAQNAEHMAALERYRALLENEQQEVDLLRQRLEEASDATALFRAKGGVEVMERLREELEQTRAQASSTEQQLRGRVTSLTEELLDAKRDAASLSLKLSSLGELADTFQRERDALQKKNEDLAQHLQSQVRDLSDEATRLKSRTLEAVHKAEQEEMARRNVESSIERMRSQLDERSGVHQMSQSATIMNLERQLRETTQLLEAVRSERNKLQELHWKSSERHHQVAAELDACQLALSHAKSEALLNAGTATVAAQEAADAQRRLQAEGERSQRQTEEAQRRAEEVVEELKHARSESLRLSSMMADWEHHWTRLEGALLQVERDMEVSAPQLWQQIQVERSEPAERSKGSAASAGAAWGGDIEGGIRRWISCVRSLATVARRGAGEAEAALRARDRAVEQAAALQNRLQELGSIFSQDQDEAAAVQEAEQLKLAHMDEEMDQLLYQNQELEGMIAEMRQACNDMQVERDIAQKAEKQLQAECSSLSESQDKLEASTNSLKGEVESLHARLREEQQRIVDAERMVSLAAEKIRNREQLLEKVWLELKTSRALYPDNAGKTRRTSASSLALSPEWDNSSHQERMLDDLHSLLGQLASVSTEASTLRPSASQTDSLRARLAEAEKEAQDLQVKVSKLQQEMELSKQVSTAKEAAAKQEVEGARSVAAKTIADLQKRIDDARAAAAAERREKMALQDELEVVANSRDAWREAARKQEAQLAEGREVTESSLSEALRAREDASRAAADLASALMRARLLEGQAADAEEQVQVLQGRVASLERTLQETSAREVELRQALTLAETETRGRQEEGARTVQLREDTWLKEKVKLSADIKRLEAGNEESISELKRMTVLLDHAKNQADEAYAQNSELQLQLSKARANLEELEQVEATLMLVNSERDTLAEQVTNLNRMVSEAKEDRKTLQRELGSLRQELHDSQDALSVAAANAESARVDQLVANARTRSLAIAAARTSNTPTGHSIDYTHSPNIHTTPSSSTFLSTPISSNLSSINARTTYPSPGVSSAQSHRPYTRPRVRFMNDGVQVASPPALSLDRWTDASSTPGQLSTSKTHNLDQTGYAYPLLLTPLKVSP